MNCEFCGKEGKEYRLPYGNFILCEKCADIPMGELIPGVKEIEEKKKKDIEEQYKHLSI